MQQAGEQRDDAADADGVFADVFLAEAAAIAGALDRDAIEQLVALLGAVRDRGGRLFILGSGGGAGHASHAVCDFRKLLGFEAYSPSDNLSELTARVNDDGWENAYRDWLVASRLGPLDGVLVFSVGGGDAAAGVSPNIVRALELCREVGAAIGGVVGRDGGFTKSVADACVVVPTVAPDRVTPHTEAFQAVVWHLIASHPRLQPRPGTWELLSGAAVAR